MTSGAISGAKIVGISCAVPDQIQTLEDAIKVFGEESVRKTSESTGVKNRYVVTGSQCTSDLCFAAAEKLLADLRWERESIDALILVTQTPDYFLPATSCSLHGRLGLAKHCAAFDLNLGCSGYVYGLWVASTLISSGNIRRVLLLVGDTISRVVSPQDRSVASLFGDAGTATAIEGDDKAPTMYFEMGTDGTGQNHLIVPAGAFRQPHTENTSKQIECEGGNVRSAANLYMDGPEVFAFTLREIPSLINAVLAKAGWTGDSFDALVFHQANRYMLQYLTKRMRLPPEKVVMAIENYGNTSSASIPLAITHSLANQLRLGEMRLVLAGFGVGLSWGAVTLTCGPMIISDLIKVSENSNASRAG
ncbi:MAG TPA: ketoacyl-ACP synthase III [Terriglobales bacterium]|nr:ketoacyl-ACP synthase III [Terriglobales bacterium]